MDTIEILREQIKELNELIKLKNQRIAELEAVPKINLTPYITNICNHEYPSVWFGTVPPSCLKCGKSEYTYTSCDNSGAITFTTSNDVMKIK